MFGTSGIRGRVGEDVTCDLAIAVGRAVASEGAETVVVGRDPRPTGEMLVDALAAGLRECGADVLDLGVAATPTVARAVGWAGADAGVAVTASHNPPADNGFKLWTPSGRAFDEDQRAAVAGRIERGAYETVPWDETGDRREAPGYDRRHVAAACDAVGAGDAPTGPGESRLTTADGSPLTVAVDLGNGAGGVTVRALERLGCDVVTLNAQPDGSFPGRPSEPTADNCTDLRNVVAAGDAALGVAHDGDADRLLAVDGDGRFVGGDVLLALFALDAAGEGDAVAAPVDTSLAVDEALASVGASVARTRVGDVFVAERADSPDVVFGGEPSGAWIWPDETLAPDGTLAACKLVELVAERGPLASQAAAVEEFPIRRDSVPVEDRERAMERVRAAAAERFDSIETLDGVRVDADDGWFLVRASGTEPVVRLTAEAHTPDRADDLFATAAGLVPGAEPVP